MSTKPREQPDVLHCIVVPPERQSATLPELHDGGDDVDLPKHAHVPARARVLPDGAETQVELPHLQERHARGTVPKNVQPHR